MSLPTSNEAPSNGEGGPLSQQSVKSEPDSVQVTVLKEHLRLLNLAAEHVQKGRVGKLLVVLRGLSAIPAANACELSHNAHIDIQLLAAYADELVARWDALLNSTLALPPVKNEADLIVLPCGEPVVPRPMPAKKPAQTKRSSEAPATNVADEADDAREVADESPISDAATAATVQPLVDATSKRT